MIAPAFYHFLATNVTVRKVCVCHLCFSLIEMCHCIIVTQQILLKLHTLLLHSGETLVFGHGKHVLTALLFYAEEQRCSFPVNFELQHVRSICVILIKWNHQHALQYILPFRYNSSPSHC